MTKAKNLLKELTLDEKVTLLSGFNNWYTNKIERLNIPSIKMSDGPNGVRGDGTSGKSSACFPCPILMGSTWNEDLFYEIGEALGEEANDKDVDVLLGPTINLHRHPLGGRHFENYSEDPFLVGKLATAYVKGVQSKKVSACLKHFIANDTEFERHTSSSNVDERTLREVYLLPFEMGVKEGNSKSVMSAYNKLNNIYCSSHKELLIDILKKEWNFDGYVVSDWGAALETVENAHGGLDLEMPGPGNTWGKKLLEAVTEGLVDEEVINDKVERILNIAEFSGRFDSPENKLEKSNIRKSHNKLLRKVASEGMVLLKNKKILPLKKSAIKKLAVIGPNAKNSQIIGGGSASLKPHYQVHPFEALQERFSDDFSISYAEGAKTNKYLPKLNERLFSNSEDGFLVEYFDKEINKDKLISSEVLKGNKFWVFEGFAKDIINKEERPSVIVRFSCDYSPDVSGEHDFEIFGIGLGKLKIDGKVLIDNWNETTQGEAFFSFATAPKRNSIYLDKNETYKFEVEYFFEGRFPAIHFGCMPPEKENLLEEAIKTSREADAVILIVGTNSDWETEGNDRSELSLPADQDKLIKSVIKENANTVVVINSGSPVSMPWINDSNAILQSWFGGQEYGNALADLIFGEINPSGKLPTTFPVQIEDTPAFDYYPGKNSQMNYEEKLLIGHRWYERKGKKPLFPFGFGLSFTKFSFSDLEVIKKDDLNINCKFRIKNFGEMDGHEVAQCYVAFLKAEEDEPLKTLQSFKKVFIEKNKEIELEISLNKRNFSYWDVDKKDWMVKPGEYRIDIGSSSEKIELSKIIVL
ncbi:glycoside hydrolase family 3 C-terminal domain-containing protein [Gammaproteobacteria bacterium]|nr:glycoside hydrolase family 3 C-terminal domain-containing protein [Gammaproteobacteria bacterium]